MWHPAEQRVEPRGTVSPPRHAAIVGAGLSGTLLAINLLRHGFPRVTLIEQREAFARGLAYSTGQASHLLNVRASNMSALPDEPDHFSEWLGREGQGIGATFATRHEYGRYLGGLLHQAVVGSEGRLVLRYGRVFGLRGSGERAVLALEHGPNVPADVVALALGNLPPHDPHGPSPAGLASGVYVADPWAGSLADGLGKEESVLIPGTGLTMADVAITLVEEGFGGRIVALSRRGLLPRAHAEAAVPVPGGSGQPADSCAGLLRRVRRLAGEVGWRAAVDALRPHTQALWMAASDDQRQRFLRHLRPWWDVHRHRLAPRPRIGWPRCRPTAGSRFLPAASPA